MLSKDTSHKVFIPGWATDAHLVAHIPCISTVIDTYNLDTVEQQLLTAMQIPNAQLIGFSMGAYLAKNFTLKHPSLVPKLILIGIRPAYPISQIENIAKRITRNKDGYLDQFYKACFKTKLDYVAFTKQLPHYAKQFELECLLNHLNYLKNASFTQAEFEALQHTTLIQGEHDLISPNKELTPITNQTHCVIKQSGHIPFFNQTFINKLLAI